LTSTSVIPFAGQQTVPLTLTGFVPLDPLTDLVDVAEGDLRLFPGAPQIDAGDPWSGFHDLDGSRTDMGAYSTGDCRPRVFCTQPLGGVGCTTEMDWTGYPRFQDLDGFDLIMRSAPNSTIGLVVFGAPSGAVVTPYGDLCIAAPNRARVAAVATQGIPVVGSCTAILEFDLNTHLTSFFPSLYQVGDVVAAQYWYRNGSTPFGGQFSDALVFTICP
ncbi:MAG: hypothetical protein AAGG01_19550, partial [Planctomycetota bacterium]